MLFLRDLALERHGRWRDALAAAETSVKLKRHSDSLLLQARCHRFLGDTEKSLKCLDRVDAMRRGLEGATCIRAGVLEEAGRFAEATRVLEPHIKRISVAGKPLSMALRIEWSKLLVQNKQHDAAVELINRTLEIAQLPPPARSQQLYLKAKALDRKGEHEAAGDAAAEANEIGKVEFDPELYTQ